MNIVGSKKVCEGGRITMLHRSGDIWLVISDGKDLENLEEFYSYDPVALFERIPGLKEKLNEKDGTTINIDYESGQINVNPHHTHIGIPTNKGPKSNRQVNLPFSFFRWIAIHKKSFLITFGILAGLFLLGFFIGWFFYIPFAGYLIWKVLETNKIRDMFLSGDLNPGIYIDQQTHKIAVLTDLSMGGGNFPVVRIKKVNLPAKYKKIGERIPIAGVYQKTEDQPFWDYFEPLPIPSGARDERVIGEKINAIPSSEWVKLKEETAKLGPNPKEGYYPIRDGKNDWERFPVPKFTSFGEEKSGHGF